MPAKPLNLYLGSLPKALIRETREVAALQRAFSAIAPKNLAQVCHVAAYHAGRVTVLTESGIFAAKIKNLLPFFLSELRQQGFDINAIEIRVQVRSSRAGHWAARKISRKISTQSLRNLARLEQGLAESPLRDAVRALLASQQKRRSSDRR
jgi:hypothetical protein